MGGLLHDLRYGFRVLFKSPGFTLVAIAALALGIGTTSAIFSLVNVFLLRPLPYPDPDRLVAIWQVDLRRGAEHDPISYPNFSDLRTQTRSFEQMAAYVPQSFNLTAGGTQPVRVMGMRVSASLFPMLKTQPFSGRFFTEDEDVLGGNGHVAVLSYGFWQRQFGGNPNIVGANIMLDGDSYTVTGIMPRSFKLPIQSPADLWTPLAPFSNRSRSARSLSIVAALRQGVVVEGARAEVATITRQLENEYKEANSGWQVSVTPLHEDLIKRARPALLLLLGVVGFVLLIACANVANLLLARGAARQKEIAIRLAMGASRFRLVRQLLTESFLLALISGALGFLLALWGLHILMTRVPEVPSETNIGLDPKVLLFAVAASAISAIVFGLLPALQMSRPDLNGTLKEGGRAGVADSHKRRMRSVLVIAESALSVILLAGAGMMIKSFVNLQRVDPGFATDNVLVVPISLTPAKYPEESQRQLFFDQLLQRIRALPGVQSVGATSVLPLLGGDRGNAFSIEGRPPLPPGQHLFAGTREVTPDYFQTMGIRVLKGRSFDTRDTLNSPFVVIINETMAQRFFPGEDPINQRLSLSATPREPWFTVVGVVSDVHHTGLATPPAAEMYGPFAQDPRSTMTVLIRTTQDPATLGTAVRNEVLAIDKDVPLYGVMTMEQIVSTSIAPVRTTMLLLTIFAVVALALALMGIFSFMSYSVVQRTHEIGVRMALGASQRHVLKMIAGQGMKFVVIGIGIGLVGAVVLGRVMSNLLFNVSAIDPLTFVGVSLVLSVTALIATLIPARKATRVDPLIAMRYE